MAKTKPQAAPWYMEQTAPNVHTIRFDDVKVGWEQWFLLRSDAHHDNAECDQALEQRHLELARERGALVFDFGDLFDAMQGKDDRRQAKSALRNENKVDNYLDSLVTTASDFYAPYARNIALLGLGNHETAVLHRLGTNLTDRLAASLRASGGATMAGGYGGWIRLMFTAHETFRTQLRIKYLHGASKNPDAQVTRGVIQTNRQAVYIADADIVVNGHSHDAYIVPIQREYLNDAGRVDQRLCWFVRTPSYKDEYRDGALGWHVESGKPPKPIGAAWLRLTLEITRGHRVIVPQVTLDIR